MARDNGLIIMVALIEKIHSQDGQLTWTNNKLDDQEEYIQEFAGPRATNE